MESVDSKGTGTSKTTTTTNVKKGGFGKRMFNATKNIGGKILKRAAVPITLWEVGKAALSGDNKSIVDATLSGLGITNPTPTGMYKPLSISNDSFNLNKNKNKKKKKKK